MLESAFLFTEKDLDPSSKYNFMDETPFKSSVLSIILFFKSGVEVMVPIESGVNSPLFMSASKAIFARWSSLAAKVSKPQIKLGENTTAKAPRPIRFKKLRLADP